MSQFQRARLAENFHIYLPLVEIPKKKNKPTYNLANEIQDYKPDPAEEDFKVAMIDLLEKHPEKSFDDKFFTPGHFSPEAWVLNYTGTKALMTYNSAMGLWMQLGGHAGCNTDLRGAAVKMTSEKSGLAVEPLIPIIFDMNIHTIPASSAKKEDDHSHYGVRYLLYANKEQSTKDLPSHLAWMTMDEILSQPTTSNIPRMVKKWQNMNDSFLTSQLIHELRHS